MSELDAVARESVREKYTVVREWTLPTGKRTLLVVCKRFDLFDLKVSRQEAFPHMCYGALYRANGFDIVADKTEQSLCTSQREHDARSYFDGSPPWSAINDATVLYVFMRKMTFLPAACLLFPIFHPCVSIAISRAAHNTGDIRKEAGVSWDVECLTAAAVRRRGFSEASRTSPFAR